MNQLLDDDDEERTHTERELTLGTGTILGIFVALVLLCGLFFGFGYKMGAHKPVQPVQPTTAESSAARPGTNFDTFKPAAGSVAGSGKPVRAAAGSADASDEPSHATGGSSSKAERASVRAHESATAEGRVAAPMTQEATAAAGYVVQIAAVSHQGDAELLVNALRAKGYPVSAHTVTQDKFFHVQVGPFANRADAEAAKQRLTADGYQPIVK